MIRDVDALHGDQWNQLKDLVPRGRAGEHGPRCDNRRLVNALLWMARSGGRWRDLPERFTETTGGTSTKTGYLWCGAILCAAYNAGGLTIARYQPQGEVQYSGGTATSYYYQTDHLGSITSTTSATGTTLGSLATDAYGATLSQSGAIPTFGYAGMFLHSASGLYLTMFRAYDPYSGRWLSRDPTG